MNNKEHYTPPLCEVITLETIGMMAMSGEESAGFFSGTARDSDDCDFGDFGASAQRRGTWGNLWED